jgi:transformation/transcription domain-associated protein
VKLVGQLIGIENEENALISLRIFVDLHKTYRPSLEPEVQPFLDIVQKLYQELPRTVANAFKGDVHVVVVRRFPAKTEE